MKVNKLVDQHGRHITHLRLSVTEQCNFRCVYCMPDDKPYPSLADSHLTPKQIKRLTKAFVDLGIQKIRLTGGEPLIRKNILEILQNIRCHDELKEIAMTTNAYHLKDMAKDLKQAGLDTINISLDSLNASTFKTMTQRDAHKKVMEGIDEALKLGFPIKMNAVIMKGFNDHEVSDFIKFALDYPIQEMRFIEFMPLCGSNWQPQYVSPHTEFIKDLHNDYAHCVPSKTKDSVAESYAIQSNGKSANIGFIRTLSKPFCGECSRIRVSATGSLRPCLFSHDGTDLKTHLEEESLSDTELRARIRQAVWNKPAGNEFAKAYDENKGLSETLYKQSKTNRADNPSIRFIGG